MYVLGLETAQWLRALAGTPEDRGAIPSIHMATHNGLQLQFQEKCPYMQAKCPYT